MGVGPYVQRGGADDKVKQNASLLKGMMPENIDLDTALRLLSLRRELGKHPETGQGVVAFQIPYLIRTDER